MQKTHRKSSTDPQVGHISKVHALGSDYHRILRRKLQKLAYRMIDTLSPFGYRVFCDSAPVLEKPLAQAAGLGWQGKHTVQPNPNHRFLIFLGEIFTDLPLIDKPQLTIKKPLRELHKMHGCVSNAGHNLHIYPK